MRMFVDDTWMNYEINHLLEIFMMFRVIFLFRLGLYYTIFMAPRAYRLWFSSNLNLKIDYKTFKARSMVVIMDMPMP